MPWRIRYLANVILVMNEDGRFTPREALLLSELRNELRLTLPETAEAVIQAYGERTPLPHASVITNERNLVDMFVGLLAESTPSAAAIDLFIDQIAIPRHRLPALLDDAQLRFVQLRRRITTKLGLPSDHGGA